MTTSIKKIAAFERRSKQMTVVMALGAGLLRAVPALVLALTVYAVVDRALDLPAWLRVSLWLTVVAVAAAAFGSALRAGGLFSITARSRRLAARARARGVDLREDDLRVALELSSGEGKGSTVLRDLYLDHMVRLLNRCSPAWSFPDRPWMRTLIVALAIMAFSTGLWAMVPSMSPLSMRVLNPFRSVNFDRFVRVAPGDVSVPLGSDVEITVETLEGDARADLMVKSATGWARRAPDVDGRERHYTVRNVVQTLTYRVRWKGEWSRRYTVTPVEPIRLSGFDIELQPPAYTGKPAATQTSPEITAFVGTRATIHARVNRPVTAATLVFSDGREKPAQVTEGTNLAIVFAVEKSGLYKFRLLPDGRDAAEDSESFPINVVDDLPPEISLLSPSEALVAGEREKIPLTYDVRDDIQVAEVRLEWELKGRSRSETTRGFEKGDTGGIFTHGWNLNASGLKPGDAVRYRLIASDANTVTGPGIATTPWMDLVVESFEREHAELEAALETWRDRTIDLLAQMNTLKDKVEKSDSDLDKAAQEFNQAEGLSKKLEEALRQIVSRMENDPLADFGVTMEHRAMLESFRAVNQALMPQARAALNTQNRPAAADQMENVSAELERMTALSEELTKRQNARDVVESGDRLEKLGEDLAEQLAGGSAKDPALAQKVNEILEEARKNLAQIAESLQKMPDELPEDFVNQEALKDVQLGKAQDALSAIADAIKRGDMKAALEMAQQFLKTTKEMSKNLSEAHDAFSKENSADDLAEKMAEQAERVDKIVQEQRAVLAETQKLETARLERRTKTQEDAFKKLSLRQRAVAQKARDVAVAAQRTAFYGPLVTQVGPIEEVAREMERRRLDKSFGLLTAVTVQLHGLEAEVLKASETAPLAGKIKNVRDEESAILEELQKLRDQKSAPNDAEKPAYDALKQRQESLAKQTGEVRQQMQNLSRKTASLGLPLTQPLSDAAQEMKAAGGQLGASDSQGALPHEEKALQSLQETQSGLSQAQASMGEMSGKQGSSGMGGPRVMTRPGSNGGRGAGNGRVRLPTAEDYRPPRAFREDLLESLKENYPKIYEDIIHRYYKRLAE